MRMIDADALLETLGGKVPMQSILLRRYNAEDVHVAIMDAPTVGGWISVKDRLPEPYKEVAVIARFNGKWTYGIGWLNGDKWVITEEALEKWTVTHWMPLPEPPKEGDNA